MKTFIRDSTVRLKFNFADADGEVLNPPAGATVSLSYLPHPGGYNGHGGPSVHTYTLAQSGDDWIYDWDSSVAAPCVVHVHAQTNGGPPTATVDTEFRLKANRANRELAGEY